MIFFQFPGIENVRCVFCGAEDCGDIAFGREHRPGDIQPARLKLFKALAPHGLATWRECHQVHGDKIIIDPPPQDIMGGSQPFPEADGMMTEALGTGLLIKTADCQPILFTDSTGSRIMAIHAGWRGNRLDFPATAVRTFCENYGLGPGEIRVVRGPSLGPCCAEFTNFDTEWGSRFSKWFDPATHNMDLWELSRSQLQEAGMQDCHIHGIDICTMLNAGSWFSWRRDKTRGRQASLIWRT